MSSKDGWCREDKEDEMQDITSRYLVTFHGDKPVGMVHFQFVEEETMTDRDAEVAYCFEIQVVPEYQRRGIGAHLISLLEAIGRATQMEKVMLTVFKASRFDYEILSKALRT
ncbi:N-alpha-acetyltransferase 40 [Mortierella alpina]|nr:N-alpha-acetyltransferase 40 [Mortierella alpina]